SGCGKNEDASARPGVPVVSSKAISQDVYSYAEAVGCCRSYASVNVVPQVYGTLQGVHFEQGAHVKSGDLLYTIDPTHYEAALNQAKARLVQAEAQLEVDSAKLERSKALLPQNYISKQEYETLNAQVMQDKAAIEAAKAGIEQANLDFQHCFITSPIDGIAGKYLVDVGNVLSQGAVGSGVLVNVQDVDRLYVDFSVSENLFPKLYKNFTRAKDGLDVSVSLIADGTITGSAKLKFLENTINKRTGSIELRAVLGNSEHKFWPGCAVNVKVLLNIKTKAVLVPSESIRLGQAGHYAFVIKDDKTADLRMVKIGQQYGNLILIKDGIKDGETVVCTGQLMLAPGMKVSEIPDPRQNMFQTKLKKDKELVEQNPTTK
ncbi:MAG: efflux RND transporter periplasmic adaptor subunit, partial [Opitutales bacterium]|nr:efflux RND transporter periplasmic adaptor subunit [Opitutales bacterium]